jgi:hypothetical protein
MQRLSFGVLKKPQRDYAAFRPLYARRVQDGQVRPCVSVIDK